MDVSLDMTYEVEADLNRIANMKVDYELHLTMVDQKVINALTMLTETKWSMKCYVCGATPKQFINIEDRDTLPRPGNIQLWPVPAS